MVRKFLDDDRLAGGLTSRDGRMVIGFARFWIHVMDIRTADDQFHLAPAYKRNCARDTCEPGVN